MLFGSFFSVRVVLVLNVHNSQSFGCMAGWLDLAGLADWLTGWRTDRMDEVYPHFLAAFS